MGAPKGNQYALGHIGGRPSKFTPEIIEGAKLYVESEYLKDEIIPTKEGLAVFLNIPRSQLYKYAEENKELSDILERLMDRQAKGLLNGGLQSKLNSTITKLMLGKHGYRDESTVDGKHEIEFLFEDANEEKN